MTRYDFKEATYFLNECVSLDSLYNDVCVAMDMLNGNRLSKKKKSEVWDILLTCADFLETIAPKEKGDRHEVA